MTTDIRAESEDGFHEIHLSGKQLVFLFMATTIVSVVIFLCGVLVGRGVRAEVGAAAGATSAPTGGADAPAAAGDPQAAATLGETNVGATELSYPERLGEAPPDENVKSSTEVPDGVASPPPPAGPPASAGPTPAAANTPATASAATPAATKTAPSTTAKIPPPQARPNEKAPAGKSDVPAAVGTSGGTKPAPPPPALTKSGYTIQVAAVKQRDEADAIARRLVSRGYDAYIVEPGVSGAKMYRVRVGRYADRADADKVVRRLTQEERFKPWITR